MTYTNPIPQKPDQERNSPDASRQGATENIVPAPVGPAIHPQQPHWNGSVTPINSIPVPSSPAASQGIPEPSQPQALPFNSMPAPRIV